MTKLRMGRNTAYWLLAGATLATASPAFAAEGRKIEEVVITAERQESTVSDTSISITAFTGDMLEGLGIRNAEDLQNMIPAAVIQPYDMAVRGVGRNFRNLGGDPGIATYANGVYSEDFGIASSEGGLFDIERVEVLRGPQGTLYGRNAIGGAVNFINKKPTDTFEGQARVIGGTNGLFETYGMLSGPIIDGLLSARATGVKRVRDGYVKELGVGDDVDNFGDENYSLALTLTPSDNLEWYVRGNERSLRRRMGGADSAGIIYLSDNGTNTRDTTTYVFGYRAVDPNVTCANALTRTATVATTGVRGGTGCMVAGRPTFTFTNPTTGAAVTAQRPVPGVDQAFGAGTTDHPNKAFGATPGNLRVLGFDDLEGSDLKTATSGHNLEGFDQQAGTSEMKWVASDELTFKYIFGYSSFFYDRITDTDLTSNTSFDRQFYVTQEAEYVSHEVQMFYDPTENLSITTGIFAYDSKITQRGDFYDGSCEVGKACKSRYANPAFGTAAAPVSYGAINAGFGFLDLLPQMGLFTAKEQGKIRLRNGTPTIPAFACTPGLFAVKESAFCFGSWKGDQQSHVAHQEDVAATDLQYQTRSERNSYSAYTQGKYNFNEQFALTLGLRWARDNLDGEENLFFYDENTIIPLGFGAAGGASGLAGLNQALGYLGPDGTTILNKDRLLPVGIPTSIGLWRALSRSDSGFTWRVNLDWTPTDDDLIYISATKGARAGGFNLVFFSQQKDFKPEELISYEVGYKGTLFDGTMQLNAALYYYDYKDVETFGTGPSAFDPNDTSTSVFSVDSARMIGFDADFDWLVTDEITLSANFSYTNSEYTSDLDVNDPNDHTRPPSLFPPLAIKINLKGKQLLQVPEMKGGFSAQYAWDLAESGKITFVANWSWIDDVYFSAFEAEEDIAPAYSRADLRASWVSADDAWSVSAYVNNVFDEIGLRQVDHYSGAEDENFRRIGATTNPRQMGVELNYKFD